VQPLASACFCLLLLDTIEISTAVAIETLLTAANLGEVNFLLQWSLAAIAGDGRDLKNSNF
jgi:hypothetical protein